MFKYDYALFVVKSLAFNQKPSKKQPTKIYLSKLLPQTLSRLVPQKDIQIATSKKKNIIKIAPSKKTIKISLSKKTLKLLPQKRHHNIYF